MTKIGRDEAEARVAYWRRTPGAGLLDVSCLGLTALPPLPPDLLALECDENRLTVVHTLPPGLEFLSCEGTRTMWYPNRTRLRRLVLPSSLRILICRDNPHLTELPLPLPHQLAELYCDARARLPDTRPLLLQRLWITGVDNHASCWQNRWTRSLRGRHAAERAQCAPVLPPAAMLYV
jgi:hypothetical protein